MQDTKHSQQLQLPLAADIGLVSSFCVGCPAPIRCNHQSKGQSDSLSLGDPATVRLRNKRPIADWPTQCYLLSPNATADQLTHGQRGIKGNRRE